MVKYRVIEIAGHARVEPIQAEGPVDYNGYRARAEAERAKQIGKIVGGAARSLTAGLADLWRRYRTAQRKRAAIAQLAGLDIRLLRDIGLERSQIVAAVDGLLSQGTVARTAGRTAATNENRTPKPRGLTDAA